MVGELSTTESAFLERSRRQLLESSSMSGRTGDSLLANHFEEGFRDGSRGARSGGNGDGNTPDGCMGAGGAATICALRDRLAGVEAENTVLRTRARRAEEERTVEAERADKATKKLAQVE